MVRPVTESRASSVSVYFPGGPNEIWYDVEDFKPFRGTGSINIPVSMDKVPVYYRGGSIIPRKDRPRRVSTLTHDDPFTLYVALDDNKSAKGTLYIDDNESYDYKNNLYIYIKFKYKDGVLSSSLIDDARFSTSAWIERVVIINAPSGIKHATLKSKKLGTTKLQTTYDGENRSLTIRKPGVSVMDPFTITLQ
ncbi:hypothetical protein RN001_015443 [Aquatica leii]|uniref:Glycosyl hydrolase family 31 C-terminal domain-containing protein n=1 Tax=Aquatica leii TaxID=1421715 RepID=A0AAN7NZ67_9COLE|nr:hypothetical protein RN001_015443 [Aquatica leii]